MLHKNLMLLFAIALSTGLNAQTEKKGYSSVGAYFSPSYSSRTVVLNSSYGHWEFDGSGEEPIMGFNTGLNYEYTFANGLTLESGFEYARKGYSFDSQASVLFVSPFVYYPPGTGKGRVSYDFVQIPVKVGYSFAVGERIRLFGDLGGSVGAMIFERTSVQYLEGR